MAASIQEEIDRYLHGDPIEAAKNIATELNKSNAKFVSFIEGLGASLTSTDNVTRGRATHMIGDVLDLLPTAFLSQDQGAMVTSFLLAKLKDHHSVQPHGLQALAVLTSQCGPLSEETVQEICHTIFSQVQNQTLSHSDRGATYRILQNLLETSTKTLQEMGGDFVIGFIQQMDAEKDPRNLLLCFNCAHFISSNFSLGVFTEEMFEVLGCYFPVDFVPPPNNPHGITKEDLVSALRKCFAATPVFAEYSVPLLLEKMGSDLQSARLDSYLTLTECAPVYGQKGLTPFLGSITSCVRREVLMNISAELVEAAKQSITAVYKAVAPDASQGKKNSSLLDETIVELYQDVAKYLDGSTDVKKSCLANALCRAASDSSPHALIVTLPLVLPSLIRSCGAHAQVSERLLFVQELVAFLRVIHSHRTNTDVMACVEVSLASLHTMLENLMTLTSPSLHLEAVKGLTLLVTLDLSNSEQRQQALLDKLLTRSLTLAASELRSQVLLSLRTILEESPKLAEHTIQSLIQQSNAENFSQAVDALVHTVVDTDSFALVNNFFLATITQGLSALTEKADQLLSCAGTMKPLLRRASHAAVLSQPEMITAMPLLRCALQLTRQCRQEDREQSQALMACFRDAFSVLGEVMEKSEVTCLWDKLSLFFLEGDVQSLGLTGDLENLQPLHWESPWQQTQLLVLLEGFLTSADIQALVERRDQLFEAVYTLALNTEDPFTQLSACRCVAAVMNKAPIGSQIQWFLEPIVDKLRRAMSPEHALMKRLRALRLWLWLAKAMECRGHSATTSLTSHLVTLLSDPDLGPEVGRGIPMVVQDMDEMFSARLHSIVTPLYKQRFFSLNINALIAGYTRASSSEIKQNHLLAVCGIVSELPLQITKPHLAVLMPLMLLALKDKENPNLSATLSTLSAAALSAPQTVSENLDSLVPRLLELALSSASMKVRISALHCLHQLTSLPSHSLVPQQPRVVRDLRPALDDKKRLVRRQAAEARSAWILLQPAAM